MSVVLVVDDEPAIRFTLRAILEDEGVTVVEARDGEEALQKLADHQVDLVVSDLSMPRLGGMDLLRRLGGRPPLVVITAHGSERHAVEAMKAGAIDYLTKPLSADEIGRVVRRSISTAAIVAENTRLRAGLALSRSMVFESDAMLQVADLVERLGPRDVTVLLTGESGTGKELVARALVAVSPRAPEPYVRFNCGALAQELAEAELFGHTRAAFTGASGARRGLFREAEGGTILLDEVGELAPAVQVSLLRVLQERVVRPVGSDRAEPVDVRIVAATHRDLATHPGFRTDLLYRLDVVRIHVPPLRERPEDIPPLAHYFARRAASRYGLGAVALTDRLVDQLRARPWPGNVRELEHTMERMLLLARGTTLDVDSLSGSPEPGESAAPPPLRDRVASFERGLIAEALERAEGNRSAAARELGVNRVTLLDKLKRHGLEGL